MINSQMHNFWPRSESGCECFNKSWMKETNVLKNGGTCARHSFNIKPYLSSTNCKIVWNLEFTYRGFRLLSSVCERWCIFKRINYSICYHLFSPVGLRSQETSLNIRGNLSWELDGQFKINLSHPKFKKKIFEMQFNNLLNDTILDFRRTY